MAAVALTPRVRIMAICEGARESKIEAGVFNLRGVRQGIIAPAFPFVPDRLSLFFVLASARAGAFPGYVRVVNDATDRVVFYSYFQPRPMFEADGEIHIGRTRLRCRFPEAGRYTIQIWFFQEQGLDVLKGELPFSIVD
jgi:hypothetical protein